MANSIKPKNRISLFQKLGEFFFVIYLITLYVFVDRDETVIFSSIAFVLFGGFAILALLQRKRFYIGKNMLAVYMTFTWMQAATFWAYNTLLAGERMKTMWLLFALFFLTYNLFYERENAHEFLLRSMYIAGIALLAYSVKTYGISGTIEMMTSGRVRLGKEINQENAFGMMNSTTIIVAFYYLLYKRSYKLFHMLIAAVSFLFAMASGSRKALLMMCIGVLFLVFKRYGIKKFYKVIFIVTIVAIVFISVIQLPAFDFITERMELAIEVVSGNAYGDNSSRIRARMIEVGLDLFKEHMLIGYGANNYAIASGFMTYSHNNFIEILVDFGLIGFLLYYMIYVTALGSLRKSDNKESKVLMVILLVRIMMEIAVVTYYSKEHWILMAFALINGGKVVNKDVVESLETQSEEPIMVKEEEPEIRTTLEDVKKEIRQFMEEEKDGICETENYYEKTEESSNESEPCDIVPFEQPENSVLVFGQGVSENEISGNNGEETQS